MTVSGGLCDSNCAEFPAVFFCSVDTPEPKITLRNRTRRPHRLVA